jgi:hypothetical protein
MLNLCQPATNTRILTALLTFAMLTVASLMGAVDVQRDSTGGFANVNMQTPDLLAYARDAKMTRQGSLAVKDHYGNPAHFVKYIIRRPQILA